MLKIDSLCIDTTKRRSELCRIGTSHGTDKSPYSTESHHRHPYTAVYDIILSGLRGKRIVLGELGILDNASMRMWREYFDKAELFGFEFFNDRIQNARTENLRDTHYIQADVADKKSLRDAFAASDRSFDILIDDSTHLFDHQINFIEIAVDFVKPGGFIIVEDIFRKWDEDRYAQSLSALDGLFEQAFFVDAKHDEGFSDGNVEPYFDNDKILFLRRNNTKRRCSFGIGEKHSSMLERSTIVAMATHKLYTAPDDPSYIAVQAGSALCRDFGLARDDDGDNISSKNPAYSETTVHYWLWKNCNSSFYGLVHYRRFFAPLIEGIAFHNSVIASSKDLEQALEEKDLILVEPIQLLQPASNAYYSVEGQYTHSHGYDLLKTREVIIALSPEYLTAFDFVMRNCQLIPYNMFFGRKEVLDEYSSWLFSTLFAVEKRIILHGRGEYQGRALAFLSERLLTVWVARNWDHLRVGFRPHVFIPSI